MTSQSKFNKIADIRELKSIEFWKEEEKRTPFLCKIYDADSASDPWEKIGEPADNPLVIDIRSGFFGRMKNQHGFSDSEIAKIIHLWVVDNILPFRVGENGSVSGNKNIVFPGIVTIQRAGEYRALLDEHSNDIQDEECFLIVA